MTPSAPPTATERPHIRVLSDAQLQALHDTSLIVLAETGIDVPVAEARDMLADAGAHVEGKRVKIPPDLVAQALRTMRSARLYNRDGSSAAPLLSRGHVAFGGLVDTFYVQDIETRRTRPFYKSDQRWMALVADALPNIEWVQVVGQAHDVPEALQTQIAYAHTVRHTTKPILVYPYDRRGLLDILHAASIIAGGEDAYREKPFMFCASVPAAPLSGTDYNIELLLACADHEVPLLYYSCPAVGGNSPATLTGTLALANADWLSGLVMHQLRRPGAPIATYGYTVQLMEMRSLIWAYSAPEMQLAYSAVAELAHWYGLPAWGITLEPDNRHLDAQAGAEMAANGLRALFSSIELVHNTGRTGAGKVVAAEAMILADEIVDYIRASVGVVPLESEELAQAITLIDEVGPLGEYVSHAHTLEHFRDFWYPSLFERSHFDPTGEASGPALLDRLNSRAQTITRTHQSEPLSDDVLRALDALERRWNARWDGD